MVSKYGQKLQQQLHYHKEKRRSLSFSAPVNLLFFNPLNHHQNHCYRTWTWNKMGGEQMVHACARTHTCKKMRGKYMIHVETYIAHESDHKALLTSIKSISCLPAFTNFPSLLLDKPHCSFRKEKPICSLWVSRGSACRQYYIPFLLCPLIFYCQHKCSVRPLDMLASCPFLLEQEHRLEGKIILTRCLLCLDPYALLSSPCGRPPFCKTPTLPGLHCVSLAFRNIFRWGGLPPHPH